MTILLLQMGGSIDKDYVGNDENHGENFTIGSPAFLNILARVKPLGMLVPWHADVVCQKDSLKNTDEDRMKLKARVERASEERILVTHGTDTILESAAALWDITDKTVVFTGSHNPEKYRITDADFNFGGAFLAVQILPPGVYIALYGEVVPWQEFKPRP
jgi:L-asparaginase